MDHLEITFLKGLEHNQQKLLRVCSVYAEDAEDKKDLFQEVLINIWQSMASFEEKSSLSTWMFRVTLNVCLRQQMKQLKKRARFQKLDSMTIENISEDEPNQEEQERLIRLKRCIKKLNDADKAVTTLYLEDLSYKEISDITGLTENNVAVKVRRIKMKLLNCINKGS
ncbi:sigma-70 family RNA polymerase sigma factor [Fulvivirgaceae bacterium PWU4]|uniref:Sigma-70 family RNA polymerase sigma factor n=1 Tax=Chryseosolibacter histidini TaxID=2782349 RepID=A0AAP2DI45_9BACT|nr:sigma-70 family RNA polymerase sigma factor [Chryseosolibacter histidini]MBT1696731.1 sigma-70 family RNA polymerase sigma factor [Chryseosolibacter histidini]